MDVAAAAGGADRLPIGLVERPRHHWLMRRSVSLSIPVTVGGGRSWRYFVEFLDQPIARAYHRPLATVWGTLGAQEHEKRRQTSAITESHIRRSNGVSAV